LIFAALAIQEDVLFTAWKAQYNKVYSTEEEEATRFQNFKLTLDRIEARNAIASNTVYGLTKFSDLSPEEFRATYLGSRIPENAHTYDVGVLPGGPIEAPQTWDWRSQNKVTPVKNQEQCGSCWAFSTVENIESIYCVKNNIDCTGLAPLSVQEIVDCDTTDQGCEGGWPYDAYQFVIQEGG